MAVVISGDCVVSINNQAFFLDVAKMELAQYDDEARIYIVDVILEVGQCILATWNDCIYAVQNVMAYRVIDMTF